MRARSIARECAGPRVPRAGPRGAAVRRGRWLRGLCGLSVLVFVALTARAAAAHETRPALLVVEASDAGTYEVHWRPPVTRRGEQDVRPVFPGHCDFAEGRLSCGDEGLHGELRVEGLGRADADVVVELRWAPGRTQTAVLSRATPALTLDPGVTGGDGAVAATYLRLGIEHIVGGWDHLAFVLGLVLLVGFERRLVWTITAFTLAHSVTLAASVLQLARLPTGAVEIVIALSIVLVAREAVELDGAASMRDWSWSRRWPWAVAFGFGLLHGFGFAGALLEIGIPEDRRALALASFNLGVELGQLAVVAGLGALGLVARRVGVELERGRWPVCVALGGLGVYWTLDRVAASWLGF